MFRQLVSRSPDVVDRAAEHVQILHSPGVSTQGSLRAGCSNMGESQYQHSCHNHHTDPSHPSVPAPFALRLGSLRLSKPSEVIKEDSSGDHQYNESLGKK